MVLFQQCSICKTPPSPPYPHAQYIAYKKTEEQELNHSVFIGKINNEKMNFCENCNSVTSDVNSSNVYFGID
jgi:uncharacterized protein with PIN domain